VLQKYNSSLFEYVYETPYLKSARLLLKLRFTVLVIEKNFMLYFFPADKNVPIYSFDRIAPDYKNIQSCSSRISFSTKVEQKIGQNAENLPVIFSRQFISLYLAKLYL
jgi:hypothetical protein